jgi:hypothetical protein
MNLLGETFNFVTFTTGFARTIVQIDVRLMKIFIINISFDLAFPWFCLVFWIFRFCPQVHTMSGQSVFFVSFAVKIK